jgi:protein SCO1/2
MVRIVLMVVVLAAAACARPAEPARYPLHGQVLAVDLNKQQITVRHQDIPGFMPGMTMNFGVTDPALLAGREPGELITATLEVNDALGRLATIARVGFEPLPAGDNTAALAARILVEGDPLPDAAFLDQTDRRRSMAEWRGSVTLLTFIYTRCPLPNYCPLMDRHFARLQTAIVADPALRERVKLVSVSFDAEYDTPAVLAAHAGRLNARPDIWTFLTGDRATIDRFAASMGVGVMREADTTITHNLRTILVGADGRITRIYSGNEWQPDAVLADIRAAAGAARRP